MKKIVLALFLLFSFYVPAYATDLVEIFQSAKVIIYVDVDSIELRKDNNNEYVHVGTIWIPQGDRAKELFEEYKTEVTSQVMFWALNKKVRQWQSLSVTLFDKKGNVIDSDTRPFKISQYNEVIPLTYGAYIYEPVMNYYNKNK